MVINKAADFHFNMATKDKEADCHRSSPEGKSTDIFCAVEDSIPPGCPHESGENKLFRKTMVVPMLQDLCLDIMGDEGLGVIEYQGILLYKGNLCLLVMNQEEDDDVKEEEELVELHVNIFSTLNTPQQNNKDPKKAEVNIFLLKHEQGLGSEIRTDVQPLKAGGFAVHEEGCVDRPSPSVSDSHQADWITDMVTAVSVPRDHSSAVVESSWVYEKYSKQITNVELCVEVVQSSVNNTTPVFSEHESLHRCNPVSTSALARALTLVYLSIVVNIVLSDEEEQGDGIIQICSNSKSSADENHDCMIDPAPRKNEDVHLKPCHICKTDETKPEHNLSRKGEELRVTVFNAKDVEVQMDSPGTKDAGIQVHLIGENHEEISSKRFSPCLICNIAVTESVLNEGLPADCCYSEFPESSVDDQGVIGFSNENRNSSSLNCVSNIDTETDDDHSVLKMSHDDTDMIHPSGNSDCENLDHERTDCENINCEDTNDKNGDCNDTDHIDKNYKFAVPETKLYTRLSTDLNKHEDIRIVAEREQADAMPSWVKTLPGLFVLEDIGKNASESFFKELNTESSKPQRRNKNEKQGDGTEEEETVLSTYYRTDCISPQFTPWVVSMLKTSHRFSSDYMSEWKRLATFGDLQVSPGIYIIRIANNGFFLPDSPEPRASEGWVRVECAFCGVRVPLMQFRGRRVEEVHRQVSPSCRFVSGANVDNVCIAGSAHWPEEVSPSTAAPHRSCAPGSGSEPSGPHVPTRHGFQSSLSGPSGEVLQTDACSDQSYSTIMAGATATAAAADAIATQRNRPGTDDGSTRNVTSFPHHHATNAQIDSAALTTFSASSLSNSSYPMSTPTASTSVPATTFNPPPSSSSSAPSTNVAATTLPSAAIPASSSSSSSSFLASDFGRSAIANNTVAASVASTAVGSSSGTGIPATAGGQNTFVNGRSENAREELPMEWGSPEPPSNSAVPGRASVAAPVVSAAAAARTDGVSENPQSAVREAAASAENASGRGLGGERGDGGGEGSSSTGSEGERQTVTYEDLGIFSQRPKRTDMAVTQVRIQTFTNWPHRDTHPASKMAEAGFYYTGHVDLVRCFYCKGGLKTWERSDEPWVEHCRWFPRCPYVRLAKGQSFVDIVQRMTTAAASGNSHSDHSSSCTAIREELVTEEVKKMEKEESRKLAQATAQTMDNGQAVPRVDPYNEVLTREGLCRDEDISEDNLEDLSERLKDEGEQIRNLTLCKMCQAQEVNILFLPCGHLVACAQCAPALRTCAICRQAVKGSVRIRMTDDDDVTGGHDSQPEGATLGEANGTAHRCL